MGDDHDAMVTVERASDRYRHVRFLSGPDSASPASSRLRSTVRRPGAATRSGSRPNAEPLEPEAKRFVECLLRRAGLDPNCYRGAPLARRVGACLRSLHARSIPEAYRRLEGAPERAAEALDSLLIGATQFFREPEVFSYLDEAVLRNFSACGDGLRVWSAGCADGAELYSLAMLLAGQGLLEGSTLVGTDCRADAIRQAEQGWFEPIRLQSLDARLRQTYFIQDRHGWKVCAALRRATLWQQGNVLADPPPGKSSWDLILCRNVAIYLQPAAAERLWRVLAEALRVGGILVVGNAERPQASLPLARLAPCVLVKRR